MGDADLWLAALTVARRPERRHPALPPAQHQAERDAGADRDRQIGEDGQRQRQDQQQPVVPRQRQMLALRSEEHTSELQSLMRISYAVFCWTNKKQKYTSELDTKQT